MRTIDISDKRGDVEIILSKKGEEVRIVGAFESHKDESIALNLRLIHKAPHTRAETLLRGVAWDRSSINLHGTIVIEKKAQQTNSFLKENVLLMSPNARAEAIPNLEIEANDVKCSHASTISKIPEEHLFYLMSRGLTKRAAEKLIVEGFLKLN
ncbi:MAG TPA: SufD family Fe-S cluster assembly protein [Candidatus Saccharimonadia bacterium]|nr:SufD family Fe-S cluster assembly protein [Candidatus Saccharimonadia bacterium]